MTLSYSKTAHPKLSSSPSPYRPAPPPPLIPVSASGTPAQPATQTRKLDSSLASLWSCILAQMCKYSPLDGQINKVCQWLSCAGLPRLILISSTERTEGPKALKLRERRTVPRWEDSSIHYSTIVSKWHELSLRGSKFPFTVGIR